MRILQSTHFQHGFIVLALLLALALGFAGACGMGTSGGSSSGGSTGCTNGCAMIGGSCGTSHRCSAPTVCMRTFCCYPPLSGDCGAFCGCR